VRGVRTTDHSQLVFLDTPGVHRPRTLLGERANDRALGTLAEVDIVCFVIEADAKIGPGDRFVAERCAAVSTPVVLVVNKVDVASREEIIEHLGSAPIELGDFAAYVPVSARTGDGVDALLGELEARLEPGPQYYPADVVTDQPESFLAVYDELLLTPAERAAWLADRQGAVVGEVLAERLGLHAGDNITLESPLYPGEWQLHVSGVYRVTGHAFNGSQLLLRYDYLNERAPESMRDRVGWIVSRVDPGAATDVSRAIDAAFEEREAPTATMNERALAASMVASASAILRALDVASALLLVVLTLVLGNTLAMGVRERTNEYGVLLALGFSPRHVLATILGEAAALGLAAGLAGVALAYPIVERGLAGLEKSMGAFLPDVHVSPALAAAATLLSALLAAAAALPTAVRASRLTPTEALRRVD